MGRSRRNRKQGATAEGEAWTHLVRVRRELSQLKSLAAPDTIQLFVWELNDFISSARKVTNYLAREPGRASGYKDWLDKRLESLTSDPRYNFFCDLRNISDKECTIVPAHRVLSTEIVGRVVLQDGIKTEVKDPRTGEVLLCARTKVNGLPEEDRTLSILHKRVEYFLITVEQTNKRTGTTRHVRRLAATFATEAAACREVQRITCALVEGIELSKL